MTDVDTMRRERNRLMDAKRRKRNALAALRGEPVGLIDAAPIRQRAKALLDLGWSHEAIVAAAGGHGTAAGLRLIVNGTSRRCERKFAPVADLPVSLAVPDTVPDTCLVPSLGATRRIRALMALGWRHDDISELIARASHHLAAGRYPRMSALDWRLVDAAYEKLSAAPGGSPKSTTRARKAGFAPPMAWLDIDDPRETPSAWHYIPTDRADAIRDLAEMGHGITEVCRRLHIGREALEKWAARNGMSETFRLLVARETAVFEHRNQHTREAS